MTALHLRNTYGDIVEVEYLDVARPEVSERFVHILNEIAANSLWYPVVTVDDRIISYGYIDYTAIAAILEARSRDRNKAG